MMLISILCLDMQWQFCWHILSEAFFAGCETGLWVNWYSEISLDLCREYSSKGLQPLCSTPDEGHQAPFPRGRWRSREVPLYCNEVDTIFFFSLGTRMEEEEKVEKANSLRLFPRQTNQAYGGEGEYQSCYQITWQTLSPCQDFFCPLVSYHG